MSHYDCTQCDFNYNSPVFFAGWKLTSDVSGALTLPKLSVELTTSAWIWCMN